MEFFKLSDEPHYTALNKNSGDIEIYSLIITPYYNPLYKLSNWMNVKIFIIIN